MKLRDAGFELEIDAREPMRLLPRSRGQHAQQMSGAAPHVTDASGQHQFCEPFDASGAVVGAFLDARHATVDVAYSSGVT